MRKYLLLVIFNIIVFFPSFGKYTPVDNELELLGKLKLPGKYFTIIRFQENHQFSANQTYGYFYKENDTIIISKMDTIRVALNLTKLEIPYKFDLSKTVFQEPVDFSNTKFQNDVNFSYCTFMKNAVFLDAVFSGSTLFGHVNFIEQLLYYHTTFKKLVDFSFSVFSNEANFDYSEFQKSTFFVKVIFMNFASFKNTVFNDSSYIKDSEFKEKVWFWNTKSFLYMNFSGTIFNKSADFSASYFDKNLIFTGSKHFGQTRFTNAIMPDTIDLSFIELAESIDFTDAFDSVNKNVTNINLYKSALKKIIPNIKFQLYFLNGIDNDKKNEIYKNLLSSLKDNSYDDLYEKFDLEYQKFYYLEFKSQWFRYWFYKNWWNFGYDKSKIFQNSVFLIILYSLIVFASLKNLLNTTYPFLPNLNAKRRQNEKKNFLKKFISNYIIAFIYTLFLFFGLRLSFEKIKFNNYYGVFVILWIYTSGLICSAFMFNLIISM